MIQLSPNVMAAMKQDPVKMFHMVRVYDANQVYISTTTYYGPLTLSNGWSYQPDGFLMEADPPRISTHVDREQYTINLADPGMIAGGLMSSWTGKDVDSRVGFVDPNGQAYLDIADTLLLYAGVVDSSAYKITPKDTGESIFQLLCASPVADLDQTKSIFLSRDSIRGRHIDDTCCDFVYSGSAAVDLKWGRT